MRTDTIAAFVALAATIQGVAATVRLHKPS